ncbi:MAG: ABC transporter ATP-binding protein [Terrisporobacter othiniensis]|uniref:ABC transporter ATP-binding protein n=1 Tax=Terrisporobacter othiniensis TaxID=1577792 RepID=UPI002A75E07F|nr:ABC transporter ATP-binding protein [Terrisporobacter othiniensis]MDY3373286.1 ABC transporter ATP-binding protein [Terrisporobacter othiniensis]
MYAIKINNICKTYRIYKKPFQRVIDLMFNKKNYIEYKALKNINLEIEKGEAVGVLGKNGAGKSTLLKIITGVVKPTSGTIDINGKISAILELNSGFDQELTGYENIYIKGAILGYSKEEIDNKIDEIIKFADIGKYINQPVRTYSSGMKSRLGFAIAVNVDPDILIVDEALSVGDDIFRTKCLAKMTDFVKNGKTIFFVSHSLFTIKSFCTKCAWIKDGELITYGKTGEVVAKYETYLKEEKAKQKAEIKKASKEEALERKDYIGIEKFKFGKPKAQFNFNENVNYEFVYDVKKEMDGLKWSFTVWDAEKKELYSSDKMGDSYVVNNSLGKHKLNVVLKDLNLLPGNYYLSGEIRDISGILYVGYANKKKFIIKDEGYHGTGTLYINHEAENYKVEGNENE